MTPDACADVEVIGWLYQFYISEKKDAVFQGLKKNQKITPENIPAATQLFTLHWIVRYLVDNALADCGCSTVRNPGWRSRWSTTSRPSKRKPTSGIKGPEDIKIIDATACGSAICFTYAFDLLYAMYEEEGYDPAEIPKRSSPQPLRHRAGRARRELAALR